MKSENIEIADLDFFFMSLDEPNADIHWADLLTKVPWAKRVSGIVGFDRVHRRCGELSTTPYLITVDADTVIDEEFLEHVVRLPYNGAKNLCWSSVNTINGLCYGNGGVKLWDRNFIKEMAFHELGSGVDFCWDDNYVSLSRRFSKIFINASPYQAFRAGYREGVKLSLDRGQRVRKEELASLNPYVLKLLSVWCSIGQDVRFGDWAILGARLGLIHNVQESFDLILVSDFDYIKNVFDSIDDVGEELLRSETLLKAHTPFNFPLFTKEQSQFIKQISSF